jgi:hypothetical protein
MKADGKMELAQELVGRFRKVTPGRCNVTEPHTIRTATSRDRAVQLSPRHCLLFEAPKLNYIGGPMKRILLFLLADIPAAAHGARAATTRWSP